MEAQQSGRKDFVASNIQFYAQEVFSRSAEIDNAFTNLSIALEYLNKSLYDDSEFKFYEHYSFHAENFLLRLTSVVDRCYLLTGSTFLMPQNKIERLGGKKYVYKEVSNKSPASADILKQLDSSLESFRESRNKVAHQAGYSNKNLTVVQAIETAGGQSSKDITDIMPLDRIKEVVRNEVNNSFIPLLHRMNNLVENLINSFSFIYVGLFNKYIRKPGAGRSS